MEMKWKWKLQVYWECEVDEMYRKDVEMRRFYDNCKDSGPLNPKNAYHGARTGPTCMKYDLEDKPSRMAKYEIRVLDFTSLYPSRNFFEQYPIGHPSKIEDPNIPVNWTKESDNPYKGLVKCFIVPPQNLKIPVIPNKYNDKLMFVLCDACGKDFERKSRRMPKNAADYNPKVHCNHNEQSRGFVCTTTHLELNMALRKGYKVTHLYGYYHWDKWTNQLFRPYVQKFMKIKAEASGWPDAVGTDPVKQQEWIAAYKTIYGIDINPARVKENAVMKFWAKM